MFHSKRFVYMFYVFYIYVDSWMLCGVLWCCLMFLLAKIKLCLYWCVMCFWQNESSSTAFMSKRMKMHSACNHSSMHMPRLTYLDLVPPVPTGTLGEESPPSLATLLAPWQLTLISLRSSLNVYLHVFFGLPFFLFAALWHPVHYHTRWSLFFEAGVHVQQTLPDSPLFAAQSFYSELQPDFPVCMFNL